MKGNKLQKRLQDLGYETDNTDWDANNDDTYNCDGCGDVQDAHSCGCSCMTKSEQEAETLGEYRE